MNEAAQEYRQGDQDIAEQLATFHAFGGMAKWGSLGLAAFLTMLVLWFCAGAGFFPGLIAGLIILSLGIYFLRSKPGPSH
ncbi:MAG TPA: aa3-type cytochrome c oxidase subunit IV [Caulobacteraceae bacterium]|nr:aa3-type cytochrome c oxidase subunit IV [Caulobacteraceae bacterium]